MHFGEISVLPCQSVLLLANYDHHATQKASIGMGIS